MCSNDQENEQCEYQYGDSQGKNLSISGRPTNKSLSNCLVPNESAAFVVFVTFSQSLIHCAQVQVDSIVQANTGIL